MKVIACCVLHYGSDYLTSAIRSVIDDVDQFWVLYTGRGSFGHQAAIPCPDTKERLFEIATEAAGDKLAWHSGDYANEGQHRDMIYKLCPDADIICIVDADEVWTKGLVGDVVKHFEAHPEAMSLRLPTTHYWRSFHKAIVNDGLHAEHALNRRAGGLIKDTLISDNRIHHFGYAQNLQVTHYKQFTHGHKAEWRWDWYHTRFAANAQIDCHPVIHDFWNPEPVDPYALGLPEWMKEHPYANLEVIV